MQVEELILNRNYAGFNIVNCGSEECKPLHHFGPAVRQHWLLHYVTSGFGRFEKDGEIYHLQPGQMFVIPPYITTYYEADIDHPWTYIWIGFKADDKLPVELPDILTVPELGTLFESFKQCSGLNNGKEAFLLSKVWEMFSILLEKSDKKSDWIDIALDFINNNYHNKISITDIADKVCFERSYFSSAFKKKMRISPQQYLFKLRMEKAADLIKNGGVKPSVAAFSVGYDDLFLFSKSFKRHFGLSPREYIKSFRLNTEGKVNE